MLPANYLHGIVITQAPEMPGVYSARHHRRPDGWRYLGSHRDLNRFKGQIFGALGIEDQRGDWEAHHIVEANHFATIDYRGSMATNAKKTAMYRERLPCVLIHAADEHHIFNKQLRTGETSELFFGETLPKSIEERSDQARQMWEQAAQRSLLRQRAKRLLEWYEHFYDGDTVLLKISRNVLQEAVASLR